ncbi:MAG: UDP-N-acetylmuramoyl-L-alanine--D-glutamate ligase [Aquiluna sp.]|nr:UDP-N-acetylmuramoyl-L-alanine--D-glutamate ligase [Aquiluna sp.]MCF8544959.1 UDP-N-acetylmuramoyl-L-alanine--D-glutamate ligase [Aquiluna sp.]
MNLPDSWHGDWTGLSFGVLGLGKSGFSVADTLIELGSKVTVFARESTGQYRDLLDVIGADFVGSDSLGDFQTAGDFDVYVVSPGFAPSHPVVSWLLANDKKVITDIDLAFALRDKNSKIAKWVLITGTNGKTTVTELVTHILNSSGKRAVSCGNIGNPILDAVREPDGYDYFVIELSSFQLHYLGAIESEVSAFLNLAPDHIDWHGSFDQYFAAKSKVFVGTKEAIIFNEQDPKTLEAAENADVVEGCRAVSFSVYTPSVSSVGFVEEFLVDRAFLPERAGQALEIASDTDLAQIGVVTNHLKANVAASTAITRALGTAPNVIRQGIRSFRLSPHRIEVVLVSQGITFIDDSKATNAHAAAASLAAFDSIVWLVGGLLKGVDPTELIVGNRDKLRAAVIIGSDTQVLEELFEAHAPNVPISVIRDTEVMATAVAKAIAFAQSGDTVLLAPAAASMDQFKDYADRGAAFSAEVRKQVIR